MIMNNINTGFEGHTNKPTMIKVNTFQEYVVNIIAINVRFSATHIGRYFGHTFSYLPTSMIANG